MKYIAHRGFRKNGSLENQISSFQNAINDNYFCGFELDIRESKDKKIVVIHDAFIDRVTKKNGLVKHKKYKELKKLGIPLLEDVLKLKTNKIIMIEIKDYKMIDEDTHYVIKSYLENTKIKIFMSLVLIIKLLNN